MALESSSVSHIWLVGKVDTVTTQSARQSLVDRDRRIQCWSCSHRVQTLLSIIGNADSLFWLWNIKRTQVIRGVFKSDKLLPMSELPLYHQIIKNLFFTIRHFYFLSSHRNDRLVLRVSRLQSILRPQVGLFPVHSYAIYMYDKIPSWNCWW